MPFQRMLRYPGVLALFGVQLYAQTLPIPRGADSLTAIARAELEGKTYPRRPAPDPLPGAFHLRQSELTDKGLTTFGNTADRKCVNAADNQITRSGDFVIEVVTGMARRLSAHKQAKIWWAPLHASPTMSPLRIRGFNTSALQDTLAASAYTAVTAGDGSRRPTRRDYFFPSGITFPQSGRWLVIAASDANWGCFLFTVT